MSTAKAPTYNTFHARTARLGFAYESEAVLTNGGDDVVRVECIRIPGRVGISALGDNYHSSLYLTVPQARALAAELVAAADAWAQMHVPQRHRELHPWEVEAAAEAQQQAQGAEHEHP